jgi:MYXO-CTERM domain-containing protein
MRLHELLVVAVGLGFFGGAASLASRGGPPPPPAGDTGDTGASDTGASDTGPTGGDDTGAPGGDDGAADGGAGTDTGPEAPRRSAAQVAGEKGGFSCAVAGGTGPGLGVLAVAVLGLVRRRRARRG